MDRKYHNALAYIKIEAVIRVKQKLWAVKIWAKIIWKQPSSFRELRNAQYLQLCNFVHSACRLVIIELMQQCQEVNLAQTTRTYEIILQKRRLSCKGIARDLRIYGWLIVDLMI